MKIRINSELAKRFIERNTFFLGKMSALVGLKIPVLGACSRVGFFAKRTFKSLAMHSLLQGNPLDHHHQLRPIHPKGSLLLIVAGTFKTARFEPLVENYQTAPFPMKQFYRLPLAVDKDKNLPA
jgi:hypothetical protein